MSGLGAVLFVVGLVAPFAILARVPRLERSAASARDILVVIPARNEAVVIGELIDDLGRLTEPPARVVVVDDGSTDCTAAVAVERARRWPSLHVEVRDAGPTPPSWNPKSWALHVGVKGDEARIAFLDADVRLDPAALGALAAAHRQAGGLLSVAPHHLPGTRRETLSLPFNVAAVIGASNWRSRRRGTAVAAFGPCLLVERAAYQRVGGHDSVRAELVDDLALAQRFRARGESLTLLRGGALVRYRMYPRGLAELIEGWTKNIAIGAARTPPIAFAAVALWVTALLLPLTWLFTSRSLGELVVAGASWAVVAAHTALLAGRVGRFGAAALAAPLLACAFVTITVRSAALTLARRPVRWKGRLLARSRGGSDG